MILFEDKKRNRLDYCRQLENPYDFYDSSAKPEFGVVRDKLNNWFSRYPEPNQSELRERFKSTFSSAFFELFIHQFFFNLGFQISIHPKILTTSKRPDFLIRNNLAEFYLEVKEATDKSREEIIQENRENSVYDFINEFCLPDFFLRIKTLEIKTHQHPLINEIRKTLEKELIKYDPDGMRKKLESDGLESLPLIKIENEKVLLEIQLLPKSKSIRGKNDVRPIGAFPIHTTFGGSDVSIKKSIEKKADKYGKLDKPYIIAINSTSPKGTDDDDVTNALLGSLSIQYSTDPSNNDIKYVRERNGVIMGPKGPKNQNVSAFFITRINCHNLHVANYWLVNHPFAKRPIDLSSFGLTYYYLDNSILKRHEGKTIKDIFQDED